MGSVTENLRTKVTGKNLTVEEANVVYKIGIQRDNEFISSKTCSDSLKEIRHEFKDDDLVYAML